MIIYLKKNLAAGILNVIFGLGAMAGPLICSSLMYQFGPNGFFLHLIIFLFMIVIFGIFRMTRRQYIDNPDSTFTPLPRDITPLGIELDPSTGANLSNNEKNEKKKKD